MAQYFEDFRDAVLDSVPSDFSLVWGGPLAFAIKSGNPLPDSDRHLLLTPSDGNFIRTALRWHVGTTSGKTTVRVLFEFQPTVVGATSNAYIPGGFLSGSGNSAARAGYVHWHGNVDRISKYNAGSDSAIASREITTSGTPVQKWLEIIRDGDTIETREWLNGESRPSIAGLSVTDGSPLPLSGFFGFSALSGSGNPTAKLFAIAVATDGDAVPAAPVSGSITQDINASGIASVAAIGQLALLPGPVSILANAIDSIEQFGITEFLPGPATILASGIPSEESVSPMAFYAGGSAVFAESIDGVEQFGDASFIPGPVSVSAVSIASESIVSSPEFIAGPVVIFADSVPSAELFGDLTMFNVQQLIRLVGIATDEAFGSTTIEGGADLSGWLTGRINIKPALTASVGVNRVH